MACLHKLAVPNVSLEAGTRVAILKADATDATFVREAAVRVGWDASVGKIALEVDGQEVEGVQWAAIDELQVKPSDCGGGVALQGPWHVVEWGQKMIKRGHKYGEQMERLYRLPPPAGAAAIIVKKTTDEE